MTRRLEIDVSESVWAELSGRQRRTGEGISGIVDSALCAAFGLEKHSLFQVSTSNALVEGVFSGAITVAELKRHGDIGLGTFAGLDGELVLLDGECFRAGAEGAVSPADDDSEVPFALVARFEPDLMFGLDSVTDVGAMHERLDRHRPSQNLFAGIRVDGRFTKLGMRAACPARTGEGLVAATEHQSEFAASGVNGTLVGFWAPEYSRAISVPGYHFHFISEDRTMGGHVLEVEAGPLRAQMQNESDLHLAIPETEEFLSADLTGDQQQALNQAEGRTSFEGR